MEATGTTKTPVTRMSIVQVIDGEKYTANGLIEIIGSPWSEEDIAAHTFAIETEQVAGWGRYNRIVRYEARGAPDSWGYALALEEDAGNSRCPHCGSTAYDAHSEPNDAWKSPRQRQHSYRQCDNCGTVYAEAEGLSFAESLAD